MSDNKWTPEPWEINDEFSDVNEHGVEVWRIDQSFNEDQHDPQEVCIAEFYGDREQQKEQLNASTLWQGWRTLKSTLKLF